MADKYLFDHLVGAAFSLWRAAFLAETMREEQDIHQSQEQFLEKVIADNMITFTDDKLNRHWTVEYYLENAKLRLMRAIELSDHYKKTKLHEALTSFLRLRGTQGVELTEYEWECAHYVLRNIFRVLAPDSNLKIVKPGLPNRER